jgi:hypothetical protein
MFTVRDNPNLTHIKAQKKMQPQQFLGKVLKKN